MLHDRHAGGCVVGSDANVYFHRLHKVYDTITMGSAASAALHQLEHCSCTSAS